MRQRDWVYSADKSYIFDIGFIFIFMLKRLVAFLVILACISAQEQTIEQLIAEQPKIGTILNNYFGCAKWDPVSANVCL